jgi:hypothetical protein
MLTVKSCYETRVNAGGPILQDSAGNTWLADQPFVAGGWGYAAGTVRYVYSPVGNTDDDALYQRDRTFLYTTAAGYRFTVPNGLYEVRLKFAETQFAAAGKRKFNVLLEGQTVLSNYDIFVAAGGKDLAAPDQIFTVRVADGELTLGFTVLAGYDYPKVNAIQVRQIGE